MYLKKKMNEIYLLKFSSYLFSLSVSIYLFQFFFVGIFALFDHFTKSVNYFTEEKKERYKKYVNDLSWLLKN